MSKDVKMLLVAAVGLGFFVWGLAYASQFGQLVSSTTQGYGNVVRALEPPPGSGALGSGAGFNSGLGTNAYGTSMGQLA